MLNEQCPNFSDHIPLVKIEAAGCAVVLLCCEVASLRREVQVEICFQIHNEERSKTGLRQIREMIQNKRFLFATNL